MEQGLLHSATPSANQQQHAEFLLTTCHLNCILPWYVLYRALLCVLAVHFTCCRRAEGTPLPLLVACPQVAQRWRFLTQPTSLMKQGPTTVLPNARLQDVGQLLLAMGYQVGGGHAGQQRRGFLLDTGPASCQMQGARSSLLWRPGANSPAEGRVGVGYQEGGGAKH